MSRELVICLEEFFESVAKIGNLIFVLRTFVQAAAEQAEAEATSGRKIEPQPEAEVGSADGREPEDQGWFAAAR